MTRRLTCGIPAAALLALPWLRIDVEVGACSPATKETISVGASSLPEGIRVEVFGVTPFLINTTSAAVEISVAGSETTVGVAARSRAPIPIAWHDDQVSPWDSQRTVQVMTHERSWPVRITRMMAADYHACDAVYQAERAPWDKAWRGLQLGAGAAAALAAFVFLRRRRRTA